MDQQAIAPPARGPRFTLVNLRERISSTPSTVVLYLIFGYLVLPPLAYILWTSLTPGGQFGLGGTFSFSAYTQIFASPTLPKLVSNTLVFAVLSSLVGVAVGTLVAWFVERSNAPGKSWAYAGAFLGFAVPGMLRVIGWIILLSPRGGLINSFLGWTVFNINSMAGMIFVEGFFWAPVTFLLMVGPFRSMDPSLEDAALIAGARPWRTLRSITARLLIPGLLSVTILTFIRAIQSFEVPLFLGIPSGNLIVTSFIYTNLQESMLPDYSQASAYGVLLLLFLLLILLLYRYVTRQANQFQTVSGKGFRPKVADIGGWRWLGTAFMVFVAVVQALPVLVVLIASFLPSLSVTWHGLVHELTFSNYQELGKFLGIEASVVNSAIVAFVSAGGAVLLALWASWVIVRGSAKGSGALDLMVSLPLVFPGVVMSLAVLVLYLHFHIGVYGTIWIFVLAYVATFTPYALRYTQPALIQIHKELEEIAYISGAKAFQIFVRILAPLLMPALIGGWVFIFLISFRELSVASLLYTAHSQVVATQILDMWNNGNVNVLSAFGTVISVISIAIAAFMFWMGRRVGIKV